MNDERLHLEYNLNGGVGKSMDIGDNGLAYVLCKGTLLTGRKLDLSVDIGPEVDLGFICSFKQSWQVAFDEDLKYYTISQHSFIGDTSVSLSHSISRNDGFIIKADIFRANLNKGIAEFTLSWQHYF